MTLDVDVYTGEFLALDSFGLFSDDPSWATYESEGVRALRAAIRSRDGSPVTHLAITAETLDAVLSGATEIANYHDDYAEGLAGAGPEAARMGRQDRAAMERLSDRIVRRARAAGLVREPERRAAR
jgi:hypothetical protein